MFWGSHCVKCPITEFFLVRIFLYSDWIRRFTVNLRIQSKYGKICTRKNSVFGPFSRSVKVFNSDEIKTLLSHITEEEIKNEILKICRPKESIRKGDIPAKVLKDSINVYIKELTTLIRIFFERESWPMNWK